MKDQKKQGIIISYVNIILSTLVNIVLTPLLISALSDEGYSIYKIMRSFAGPLSMLNLGVSTVVARNVAKYLSSDNAKKQETENMYATSVLLSVAMGVLIFIVGFIMQAAIPNVYKETFSLEDIRLAQNVFLVFIGTTSVHILTEPFRGAIMGHGHFIIYYGSQTVQYILRFSLIYLLTNNGLGVLSVAIVDLVLAVFILLVYCIYVLFILKQRIRFYYIDKSGLLEFGSFAISILLQAIVNQVNNNLDIIILGASATANIITMYSSALTIYSVYNMLISVFHGVYLPQATKLIQQNATGEQLTDFIIRPGRIQAMIAVCVLGGFAVAGMDFISIWIGYEYKYAYYVALFLMIPVTIPLVESVAIAILDAKLKRVFRSITLVIMAVLNAILTIYLVRIWSFWGALIGTVISLVFGHGLLMNIYYKKTIGINVKRMFKEIFSGTLLAGIIAVLMSIPLSLLLNGTLGSVIIKLVFFMIIYFICMFLFGFKPDEKDSIGSFIKKHIGRVIHKQEK